MTPAPTHGGQSTSMQAHRIFCPWWVIQLVLPHNFPTYYPTFPPLVFPSETPRGALVFLISSSLSLSPSFHVAPPIHDRGTSRLGMFSTLCLHVLTVPQTYSTCSAAKQHPNTAQLLQRDCNPTHFPPHAPQLPLPLSLEAALPLQ